MWTRIIIIVIIIIIIVVVVVGDDTYYWVYLSSDYPFQVYYKMRCVITMCDSVTKWDKFITKCDSGLLNFGRNKTS